MKSRIASMLTATGLALALCATANSADPEKVMVGEGACSKCILKETKECGFTLTTADGGKKVTYYVAANKVSEPFSKQVCAGRKQLIATGTVKTVDGKLELTPTRMELAK